MWTDEMKHCDIDVYEVAYSLRRLIGLVSQATGKDVIVLIDNYEHLVQTFTSYKEVREDVTRATTITIGPILTRTVPRLEQILGTFFSAALEVSDQTRRMRASNSLAPTQDNSCLKFALLAGVANMTQAMSELRSLKVSHVQPISWFRIA